MAGAFVQPEDGVKLEQAQDSISRVPIDTEITPAFGYKPGRRSDLFKIAQ
jgi:hypothetical protein